MTLLVAAKDPHSNNIYLLSDARATDNVISYERDSKWTEFENFYVGISGDTTATMILREYIYDDVNRWTVTWMKDVVALHKTIEGVLREEIGSKPTVHEDRDYQDLNIMVVTNKGEIYTTDVFLCTTLEKQFGVIGSGSYHAQSVLDFMYNNDMVNHETLLSMMESVYKYKYTCGGPTYLTILTIDENEQADI